MTMLLIRADFAKSYIAAHTRTLPSGKVVQVAAFSDKRYKQAMRDVQTPDMFKPDLPVPTPLPVKAAKNPQDFTPDLFTGKEKAKPFTHEKRESLESEHRDKVTKEPAVEHEFRTKYNELTEAKELGIAMQNRCRDVRAWVSHQKTHGAISEADYDKWIGMVNEIHDENKPLAAADKARAATKDVANSEIPIFNKQAIDSQARKGTDGAAAIVKIMQNTPNKAIAAYAKEILDAMDITPMAKSFPRILFFKSHIKEYTDKNGRMVKEHDDKRMKKLAPVGPGRKSAAPPEDTPPERDAEDIRGSAHGYGTHNIEEGDAIKFKAGDFEGGGKVKSAGKDGAVVTDASGRDHNVHWHEVTGFKADRGDGGGKKPPVDDAKPVADAPEPPKKEEPVEAKEPAADKPTNVVDIKSKKTNAEDIARALFDTSEIAKLPPKSQQPEEFDSWEKISAKAPEALQQFTAMLKQVSGALDLEEGRRPSSFNLSQSEENTKAKAKGRSPETLKEEDYMSPALWNNPRGFLFMGPLKSQDRAQAKVTADYTDPETKEENWKLLKDMVRATIAVPAVTQIPKVLAEMKKAGIKLAQQPKNNLTGDGLGGSGYRDLNLIVQMPNGMMCELQIHCKPMTEAKEHGHEYYAENAAIERKYPEKSKKTKEGWSPEDVKKYGENFKTMKTMYDAAWEKIIGGNGFDENNLHKALAGRTIILWKKRGSK